MPITDRAEEILESLWIECAEHAKDQCDTSLLRDDDAIKELISHGYLKIHNHAVRLTQKGEKEARSCVRRHRLAERLFVDVFDCKKKMVHDKSCRFEHLLHEGLDESICTILGHPKECPHGRSIPEGNCCREAKKTAGKVIMPLSELEVRKKAVVSYLHTKNREALKRLLAMGVLPTMDIVLNQNFPSYVFQIGESQFAIDKELASAIFVRVNQR
ncbi:MAG: metal-dependent transcriptional regulator [Candidatus Aureabacteria bacterium]|nr:metal-dependent transcriptional regulator [Candidatus Auribacterota bacterium]